MKVYLYLIWDKLSMYLPLRGQINPWGFQPRFDQAGGTIRQDPNK
jgi:hypothetical protein